MFDVAQDPARCSTEQYYISTPLAPPLAARAAVYLVLPPPVGGRTLINVFYKILPPTRFNKRIERSCDLMQRQVTLLLLTCSLVTVRAYVQPSQI